MATARRLDHPRARRPKGNDLLRSSRSYMRAFDHEEAMLIMTRGGGGPTRGTCALNVLPPSPTVPGEIPRDLRSANTGLVTNP